MVTTCCIEGCSNNSNSVKNNSTAISFHAFPVDVELRQKWLRAISRPYWNPPSHIRICSAHFDVDEMNHDGSKARIKGMACPGSKLPHNNSFSASDVKVCRICLASDVRLFSLELGQLKICMEVLTELYDKSHTAFDLPQFVCCECGSQLLKYNRLIEKSLIAQATLLDIFADNGCITKSLIQQENRRALNLHSTLCYSEPAPVITIQRSKAGVSIEEPSKSNEPNDNSVYKHQIQNTKENNQEPTKKQNNEKKKLSNHSDKQTDPKHIKANNELNLTIKLKEESDVDFVQYDIDDLDLKTDDISDSEHLDLPMPTKKKIKVEVSKPRKKDSNSVKQAVKAPKRKLASKPKSTEYCDVGKLDDHDLKGILEEMDKVLESSGESDVGSDDAAVDSEALSDSSEDECLQSLKNQAEIKKMADNYLAKLDKKITTKINAPEKRVITRQEKVFVEAQEKLKLFKIIDMPLKEQIEAWKAENEQPVQLSNFECKICTRKFVRKKAHDKHLRRHDASRGKFKCKVCKERFRNELRMIMHAARNHEKKYECTVCPKVLHTLTTRRSTAWEHVRSQHAHAHHCARCGHTFINAKGLTTHRAMTHQGETSEPEDPHPCEQCNIVFHSEGALNVHLLVAKQHQGMDIKPSATLIKTCKRCGKQFPKAIELARHIRREHKDVTWDPTRRRALRPSAARGAAVKDTGPYPLPCEHCGAELKSRFEHWCHVRREHPEHRHAYRGRVIAICATCGKCFQNKTMLHRHEMRHRGPASFACGECPRKFYDAYSLGKHAFVHAPQRPYPCDVCGRTFTVKGNMERHRRYAHEAEKPILCTECGRAFKIQSNYKRHLRMHTGETPYTCKYCGKKFRYWESLSLHEKHMHQKVPWPARDRTRGKRAQAKHDGTAED